MIFKPGFWFVLMLVNAGIGLVLSLCGEHGWALFSLVNSAVCLYNVKRIVDFEGERKR